MNNFFKENKKLVIGVLALLVLAGAVLVWYKVSQKKIVVVKNPDQVQDFNPVYGNATFNILPKSFEGLEVSSKLYLEFLLPKSRQGEEVQSNVSCSPVNVNLVYVPNLTAEQKAKMSKEVSEKVDTQSLLKNVKSREELAQKLSEIQKQVEEKYGYVREVKFLDSVVEIAPLIQDKRLKSIILIGTCKDEECFEINKDCVVSIKFEK